MQKVTLTLMDYSLQRKIKTLQNLSLIIVFTSIIFLVISSWFERSTTESFQGTLLMIFAIFAILIILLSIPFLFNLNKIIGEADISDDHLTIKTYGNELIEVNLGDVYLELSVNGNELDITQSLFDDLPDWGNYVVVEGDNKMSFEFEVNASLLYLPKNLRVRGSALLFNTKNP